MTPEELAALIRAQLLDAARAGDVGLALADVPERVRVERPRAREHGDWATNVALQLAGRAHARPRDLAQSLAARLGAQPGIASVDVAGPGFVNIRLEAASAGQLARDVVEQGAAYGRSTSLAGHRVNLEYVSANPTGPIHVGGARWAAVGDSLARLLVACGAQVTREYYFNDHGTQIDRFARSLRARALGEPTPEDGYAGAYIEEIERRVRSDARAAGEPDPAGLPEAESLEAFRARGVDIMFGQIKSRLHEFRADFDVFFHEQSLYDSGAVHRAFARLRERGLLYRSAGATWLKTSAFGDDKDRVLVKSNGETTYFAADVAYYLDKRRRGADIAIYLLGADHHGYIGRMMAMCRAFGDTSGKNMQILIGQMVNLIRNGEPVRMSKRAGTIVTLDDLVEAVGVDAARYSLVRESMDSNIDLDLDLVASHTNENPVYYVQYAHARCVSVDRHAAEHGVRRDAGFEAAALDQPADADLLGVLAQFPQVVGQAARTREPHRVARYLEGLASAYHQWYGQCRVTPRADEHVSVGHVARLWLNDAVARVLANGLALLGVDAPDRM